MDRSPEARHPRAFPTATASSDRATSLHVDNAEPISIVTRTLHQGALLEVADVAVHLKCSVTAAYARIERGHVPGVVRLGGRVYVHADRFFAALDRRAK